MPFKRNNPGCPCNCGSNTVLILGCPCPVPLTLYQTVTNPTANFNMFHDCTLQYGPPPSGLSFLGANAMASTASFTDDFSTDLFYYVMYCSSGFFFITRAYPTSIYGSPYIEAARYRWLYNATGNTCSPFLMTNGRIFTGGDASTVVTLSE